MGWLNLSCFDVPFSQVELVVHSTQEELVDTFFVDHPVPTELVPGEVAHPDEAPNVLDGIPEAGGGLGTRDESWWCR